MRRFAVVSLMAGIVLVCTSIVWAQTSASFDYEPQSGTAPLNVDFTDTSTGPIISWNWYKNGVWFSDEQNPSETFTQTSVVELVINEGVTPVGDDYWLSEEFEVSIDYSHTGGTVQHFDTIDIQREYPGAAGLLVHSDITGTISFGVGGNAIITVDPQPDSPSPTPWMFVVNASPQTPFANIAGNVQGAGTHNVERKIVARHNDYSSGDEIFELFPEYTTQRTGSASSSTALRNADSLEIKTSLFTTSGGSAVVQGTITVRVIVDASIQPIPYESSHSELVIITGGGDELVRPFNAADEGVSAGSSDIPDAPIVTSYSFIDLPTFAGGHSETATAFSSGPAVVHAAKPGTVTRISPPQSFNCDQTTDRCYVAFDHDSSSLLKVFSFLRSDVQVVTIQTAPGQYLSYLVRNPHQYISVGQAISEGCPIGESVPVEYQAGLEAFFFNAIDLIRSLYSLIMEPELVEFLYGKLSPAQFGPTTHFTVMQDVILLASQPHIVPVVHALVEYPEAEPRACDYQPSACLNADPELTRPELWGTSGSVEWWSGGGVVLNPGGRIDMQLSLDSMTSYSVEAWARTILNAPGQIAVQLGQTYATLPVAGDQQFKQLTLSPNTYSADLGLLYTLAVSNTGTTPVYLKSICVSDGSGGFRPPVCYFVNPSFDGLPAAQGWSTTGDVNDGIIPGEIVMKNNATISQNVQLYPDGANPHTYFVWVIATVGGDTLENLKADATSTIGFNWYYDMDDDFFAGPNAADGYPVSGFFTGIEDGYFFLPNNEIKFFGYVDVASFTNAAFTIEAVITSANEDLFARVREVCIDDPFNHHDDPDAWIPPPPFQANCVGISPPHDNEIGPWIFYHWANLDRFFQCDLMVLLNRMHDTAQQTFRLIGWQFRWLQSVFIMAANWLSSDLVGWLGGHFRNMAVGQVTTIENAPGASLWDVLLALVNVVLGPIIQALYDIISVLLGILQQVVNLLLSVIEGIITVVLAIISQALNLLNLGQMLLNIIVSAYNNATPTALPGMPDCTSDPQASAWCIAMWVLENTIFSGTGAAIIPLISGIISIHLILWVVGEIRRTIMQVGQTA